MGNHLATQTTDYNLIIKLHMWVYYLEHWGGFNFGAQMKLAERLNAQYEHVRLLPPEQYNIVPYLEAADVLVSEASSTLYEMMALDKPVIVNRFYKLRLSHRLFRNRLFRKRLDAKMNDDTRATCYELNSPRQLGERLAEALSPDDPFAEARATTKREMLGPLDGQSSMRIRDILLARLSSRADAA